MLVIKLSAAALGIEGVSRSEIFDDATGHNLDGFYSVKNEVLTSEKVTIIKPKKEGEENGK